MVFSFTFESFPVWMKDIRKPGDFAGAFHAKYTRRERDFNLAHGKKGRKKQMGSPRG